MKYSHEILKMVDAHDRSLEGIRRKNRAKAEDHLWDAVRLIRYSDPQLAQILTKIAEKLWETRNDTEVNH